MRSVLWRRKAWTRQAVALVAVVAALGAGQTVAEPPPAESLKQRVTAFWEARIQGDEVTAYQYEAYAYTGALTATQYVQARSPTLKYMSYTIDNIQEQENQAQVTVRMQYRLDVPGMVDLPMAMAIQERWDRLDDGQWYRNLKPEKTGKTADQQG